MTTQIEETQDRGGGRGDHHAPAPPAPSRKFNLHSKVGGIPVWVLLVGLVAGIASYLWWHRSTQPAKGSGSGSGSGSGQVKKQEQKGRQDAKREQQKADQERKKEERKDRDKGGSGGGKGKGGGGQKEHPVTDGPELGDEVEDMIPGYSDESNTAEDEEIIPTATTPPAAYTAPVSGTPAPSGTVNLPMVIVNNGTGTSGKAIDV